MDTDDQNDDEEKEEIMDEDTNVSEAGLEECEAMDETPCPDETITEEGRPQAC